MASKYGKLYLDNGYINVAYALDNSAAALLMLAARSVGKTHGIFAELVRRKAPHIYLRMTTAAAKKQGDEKLSQLVQICNKEKFSYELEKVDEDVTHLWVDGELITSIMSLTSMAKIRGVEYENLEYIWLEEFIRDKNEKRMLKNEWTAFAHGYETFARNREIEGKPPIRMIFSGNYNVANSDIIRELHLYDQIEEANRVHDIVTINDISVVTYNDSPISAMKQDTLVYRMSGRQSDFYKTAITNEPPLRVKKSNPPLHEYEPFLCNNKIYIYAHKTRYEYYVTKQKKGAWTNAEKMSADNQLWTREQREKLLRILHAVTQKTILYNNTECAAEILSLLGIDI